jgi:hypothetical protein
MSAEAVVEQILKKLLILSDRAGKQIRFLRRYLLACVRTVPGASARKVIFYDEKRNIYFSLFAGEKSFEIIARKVAQKLL